MKINRNLHQMRAEVLLNYLYPEMENEWIAQNKGTFYRNYNQDLLAVEDGNKVQLSRDGFLRHLPEGLLTNNDELLGEDSSEKFKKLEWRRELLTEAFSPFDTYVFHKKLTIERYTSELLDQKLEFLLQKYFGIDLKQEPSDLVREAAVMLPYICRWRGDFGLIASLLGALMNCEVETSYGRYSQFDTTISWLPKVKYELMIPGLTGEEYKKKAEELEPLILFLREWFIPFEVKCEINIKDHLDHGKLGDTMILDYNTDLCLQTDEMK